MIEAQLASKAKSVNSRAWYVLSACLACGGPADSADTAATANPGAFAWIEEHAGKPLDLTGFELTFADEFENQTVTREGGKAIWLAPVHSSVGSSVWDQPSATNNTYKIGNGVLTIRATKAADGVWHAGNIQTVDRFGKGFGQKFGYFEARMKFPPMPGAWCAFWLKSQAEFWDTTMIRSEIDVIEWYGGDPRGHHHSIHLRPHSDSAASGGVTKHWYDSNYSRYENLAGEWHVHGVLIDPKFVTVYLDGKEVARFPTLPEFHTAYYPLLSLTLYKEDLDKAVSPFEMQIDYVKIYKLPLTPQPPVLNKPG